MNRVQIAVGPQTGSAPVQPLTDFTSGALRMSLVDGPQIEFPIGGRSVEAQLIDSLATDVWVYLRGVPSHRLRVLPVSQQWTEDGGNIASIVAVGYKRVVEARHIISGPPTFAATDQGTIIWNLIQHTQAQTGGNLGITAGTILTGQLRDRLTEYKIGDPIGKLTDELGKVNNGAWWGIDVNKVLTVKLWTAFASRTDPIALGVNARSLSRRPATSFANVGGSQGSAPQTVPEWIEDVTVATDPRGRWETFDASHGSVEEQPTVHEYAQGALDAGLRPGYVWTFDLDPAAWFEGSSNYAIGEFVPLSVPQNAVDELAPPAITVNAQITELAVGFDQDGAMTVSGTAVEV